MTDRRDPQPPIGEDDLQAHVDERLDAARLAHVRRYLEEQPEVAARVRAIATQRDALRAALAHKACEPIPARLRVAHLRAELRRRRWRRLRSVAASALLLLLGAGAGWLARGGWDGLGMAAAPMAEAVEAHRIFAQETRRPALLAAADADDLGEWLTERLGAPVVVPDLLGVGYRPLDGHLLPSPYGTAALVMYERTGGGGTRLSFYLRPAPDAAAERLRCADHPGGFVTYYWFDGRFGYAVTAALPREELRGIAHAAEREVQAGPRHRPGTRIASGGSVPRVCVG